MLTVSINSFAYHDQPILHQIEMQVKPGSHISILGESGCGKSTLLKIIYGLLHLEDGQVFWEDQELLGPNFNLIPGEPFIKYLPQDFDLMPYISVADNVGKHLSRNFMQARKARVDELLDVVDMTAYKDTDVKYLSGGQKQRTALARAIAKEPKLLLLDEPFSHIDNFRRNALRRKLYAYLKNKEITCITATHDSEEALTFSDEIKIMRDGSFIQDGPPSQLFNNPKDAYVASFFGDVNTLKIDGKKQLIMPHQLSVVESETKLKVRILKSYYKGHYYLLETQYKEQKIYVNHPHYLKSDTMIYLQVLAQ